MTRTRRHLATLGLFVAVCVGFGGLAVVLHDAQPHDLTNALAQLDTADRPVEPVARAGARHIAAPIVDDMDMALDRICEGLTAQVPLMVLADQLVAERGLTDVAAHDLVRATALTRCAPPVVAPSEPTSAPQRVVVHQSTPERATQPVVAAEPVAKPAPAKPAQRDVVEPTCAAGEEQQGELGCVAVQQPNEHIGGQIDVDGQVCTVVGVTPDELDCSTEQ